MKSKATRIVVPALLFLAIAVVAFNAWFAFRAVTALLNSQRSVEHTWQVINQVERIMSSAKDAETGTRGYLLTGDTDYLQPYREAVRDLPHELDRFQSLTSDNPSQQKRIEGMRSAIQHRFLLLQQSVELRRVGSTDMMQSFLLSGTGKAEMDRLRVTADQMEAEESRLLVIRTAGAESNSFRARNAVALASAIDLLLIVFTFRYLVRERNLRILNETIAAGLASSRVEVMRRAEEVHALNETLEQSVQLRTAELEATNRELEAFSYSVSHDLRAPLRTIDGFSLALEEDYSVAVDDTGRDYIRRVRAGVQRMGQLIDALLQLSRITRAEITREVFDISEVAETVASALRDENPGRDLTFHIERGSIAEGDPKLLLVALENLLGNAVKFSSKMPSTVVDFGWDKQQEAWFVRDNGAGFDMHYKDKLFNAFNRLHGDKDFKGSGIGLATVARVIHRHHGKIWADSVVNHGASFWFTLG